MMYSELKRVFSAFYFYGALLLGLLVLWGGLYQYTNGFEALWEGAPQFTNNVFDATLAAHFGFLPLFPALLAVLPFADSFVVDKSNHYVRYVLARTTFRHYIFTKLWVNAVVGALATGLPSLIFFIAIHFVYPRGLLELEQMRLGSIETGFLGWLYRPYPDLYILSIIGLAMFFGATYATFGFAIALYAKNRYVVLTTPFLYYHMTNFILGLMGLGHWRPPVQFAPYDMVATQWYHVFIPLVLLGLGSLIAIFWQFPKIQEML